MMMMRRLLRTSVPLRRTTLIGSFARPSINTTQILIPIPTVNGNQRGLHSSIRSKDNKEVIGRRLKTKTHATTKDETHENENDDVDVDEAEADLLEDLFSSTFQVYLDSLRVPPKSMTFQGMIKNFAIRAELKRPINVLHPNWDEDEFLEGAEMAYRLTLESLATVCEAAYDAGVDDKEADWIENGFDSETVVSHDSGLVECYETLEETSVPRYFTHLQSTLRDVYHSSGAQNECVVIPQPSDVDIQQSQLRDFEIETTTSPEGMQARNFVANVNIKSLSQVKLKFNTHTDFGEVEWQPIISLSSTLGQLRTKPTIAMMMDNAKMEAWVKETEEDEKINRDREAEWNVANFPLFKGFQ